MAYVGNYKNENGKRIPSVTTVIGSNIGWNKSMLMAWQNRLWEQGIDPRTVSKEACDIGTVTHELIEAWIFGQDSYEPDEDIGSETVFAASEGLRQYIDWSEGTGVEYLESEIRMVSEEYQYAGTADAIVRIDDKIYLVDFKTSKGVYDSHLVQLAAYRHMIHETTEYKIDGCILVKIDKRPEVEQRVHAYYLDNDQIDNGWEVFKQARELHETHKGFGKYLRKLNKG